MGRPKGSKNKPKHTIEVMEPHASEIPGAPPQDPRYGDKTPAYAEWLFKFFPDKAKKLYAGRKLMGQTMPVLIDAAPVFDHKELPPQEGDLPADAMEAEAPEVWFRR